MKAEQLSTMPTRARIGADMIWPLPGPEMEDLEWKLRYGSLTTGELLDVAGIVHSYMFMIGNCTQKRRNMICEALKNV